MSEIILDIGKGNDPSLIRPKSDFIRIRETTRGAPGILMAHNLREIFLETAGGQCIKVNEDPSSTSICIDFNQVNQSFADGALVPGTQSLLRARRNVNGTTEILSNEGRLVSPLTTDHAFFILETDLNAIRTGGSAGTWLVEWEQTINAPFNSSWWGMIVYDQIITGIQTSANRIARASVVAANFGGSFDGTFLGYSDGAAIQVAGQSTAGGNKSGIKIKYQLEKRGSPNNDYIMRSDIDGALLPTTIPDFTVLQSSVSNDGGAQYLVMTNEVDFQGIGPLESDNWKIN